MRLATLQYKHTWAQICCNYMFPPLCAQDSQYIHWSYPGSQSVWAWWSSMLKYSSGPQQPIYPRLAEPNTNLTVLYRLICNILLILQNILAAPQACLNITPTFYTFNLLCILIPEEERPEEAIGNGKMEEEVRIPFCEYLGHAYSVSSK